MTMAIVAGAIANKAGNGGAAWTRLSWTIGLANLGFDVHFIEELAPGAPSEAEVWFAEVMGDFGLTHRATLLRHDGSAAYGHSLEDLVAIAADADLLLNISGHLTRAEIVKRVGATVFIDLDPGYTQIWHANGTLPLQHHDRWFTVGQLIGTNECRVPTAGIEWQHTLQPVVLSQWPAQPRPRGDRFTTVASWRGPYGPVEHEGRTLGAKVHEFRAFIELPRLVDPELELCLDIHPADAQDRDRLEAQGWTVVDPTIVAGTRAFRRYVQESTAELSVAQSAYVHANTGWFSDRSARYLASGRPVVVQDTGLSNVLEVGEGLLTFTSCSEACAAIESVMQSHDQHSAAARAFAERHLDARHVIGRIVEEVGVAP